MDNNQDITIERDANSASRPDEPIQPTTPPAIGPNPYKGLSAFNEEDAERFFGREFLIQELRQTFRRLHETRPGKGSPPRLLTILGPSGFGKSSVARAGLIPELARRPLPGLRQAQVTVFTPGTRPLRSLATILARLDPGPQTLATKTREFTTLLKQRVDGQWDGLLTIADTLPKIEIRPLILLVDQCEELYALCEHREEREQFINNLLHAASDRSGHVSVILTLRSRPLKVACFIP